MRRITKGYTGVEIELFPTMLTSPTPESSPIPSRFTSSPSLSSEPSTDPTFEPQPSRVMRVPIYQHPMNHSSFVEDDLKRKKQTYSTAFTKLILRIKKLESKVKTGKARKRRFMLSEDEEDDSFKQGKKISDIDEDPNNYFSKI
ncbi:hypothetical protein Tco_0295735 [Tanacetum coccineum]